MELKEATRREKKLVGRLSQVEKPGQDNTPICVKARRRAMSRSAPSSPRPPTTKEHAKIWFKLLMENGGPRPR